MYCCTLSQARIADLVAQHAAAINAMKEENAAVLYDTKKEADKRVADAQAAADLRFAGITEELTHTTAALELVRTTASAANATAATDNVLASMQVRQLAQD